jgi:hypothetical protein
MKKIVLFVACLGFMASASFAQDAPKAKTTQAQATAVYVCPKCHATADKAGQCAHCKVAMVKDGDYYCPGCYASSSKPGKCTKCNKDMVKMDARKH